MQYLYWFKRYAWSDKIRKIDLKLKSWDLIKSWEYFYLVLWENVSFPEQYTYEINKSNFDFEIIEKKLLNKQIVSLVNWMSYWRYSPYYNVIPKLFLPTEIEYLLNKKIWTSNKKTDISNIKIFESLYNLSQQWQNLIVFPDLRTLMNWVDQSIFSQKWVDLLLSSNTQNQKNKSRRNIKNWNTNLVLATHSEIFQNYKNLKKIIILWPYKRYYSNQQDPRYKTLDVVKKFSEIRDCELQIIEN